MAEAINVGWGAITGSGSSSLVERLQDRQFRTAVAERLRTDLTTVDTSPARKVLCSEAFIAWLQSAGTSRLEDHLSDRQLRSLGVDEANGEDIGRAIGNTMAAVAFERADFIERELIRLSSEASELSAANLAYLQDIWELLSQRTPRRASPEFPIRYNLNGRGTRFRGRTDELAVLEHAVAKDGVTAVTQAIAGLGGVGKTYLAREFVRSHADGFDLVAWIDAATDVTTNLEPLAPLLGVQKDAPVESAEAVLDWLGTTQHRCLVVFDNLEDREFLANFPSNPHVAVLVTTRLRNLGGVASVLCLDVFSRPEACNYLLERANGIDVDADRVASALGDLPLALSHAGAYCAETGTSLADYADMVEDLPSGDLFQDRLDEFYEQVVHETWTRSIAQLRPLAKDILDLASYLDPTEIPLGAFTPLAQDDANAKRQIREATAQLHRWSLAERPRDGAISVHRRSAWGLDHRSLPFCARSRPHRSTSSIEWHGAATDASVLASMAGCPTRPCSARCSRPGSKRCSALSTTTR